MLASHEERRTKESMPRHYSSKEILVPGEVILMSFNKRKVDDVSEINKCHRTHAAEG